MSRKNRVHQKPRPAATAPAAEVSEAHAPGRGLQAAPETVVAVNVEDSPAATVVVQDPDREGTIDIYKQALESFDRTMINVSGGALAVSITFLHDVAPSPTPWSLLPLIAGWGGLIGSLGAMIISMPVGHKAIELRLAGEDDTKMTTWTTRLNTTSVVTLFVGFLGLAAFAGMNMFAAKPRPPEAKPVVVQCVAALQPTASAAPVVPSPPPTVQPPPPARPTPAPKTRAPAPSLP